MTRAVLFDVDFTLIYPGPMFQGEGYQAFCARHLIEVDPAAFDTAVASAASILDDPLGAPYDAEIFVAYTRHIIEQMGGRTAGAPENIDACAREIYAEWAGNHHFELYDDVAETLQSLTSAGVKIGLISNSHRPLDEFQSHFELRHFISAAVSSADIVRVMGSMRRKWSVDPAVSGGRTMCPASSIQTHCGTLTMPYSEATR